MAYIEGRLVHDADAHIMETEDFLSALADPAIRDRLPRLHMEGLVGSETGKLASAVKKHGDPAFRAQDAAEIMLRKNWDATGSFLAQDRPKALDLIGVASQLIFNTFVSDHLQRLERGDDLALVEGAARAHNRAMLEFCGVDARLFPSLYVPLADFDLAERMAREAIKAGARGLLVPSRCPRRHSPSHIALDRVWAQAEEAGVPILFHVGGGGELLDPMYFENGLPPVADFHGGGENFTSVDYMAIPVPPAQTIATLIIDGVMERFPKLKFGVIEQGSVWVPGLMRQLDSAHEAFARHEERLRKLSLKPSEYIRRQLRVTPYPTEDVGWVIREAGEEVCLFSSDFPHVEGGRDPVKRFEKNLAGCSEQAKQRFYRDNFEDLMGKAAIASLPKAA
ncbi:amidohydrolase family protein [Desertibaculum subflavum]|uniref:amidohydrolase family protein n=1 Tax=Desertibaculum subflavum TaxID=2268458 RepID=UPI000E667222